MAESVRAASLKNSVKEAMAAPTAKRTHKGEEEMENNSARLMAEEEAAMQEMERKKSQAAENAEQRERNRERSASISQADSPFPDESRGAFPGSPAPGTPSMDQQDSPSESFFSSSSASRPRPRHSLTGSSSLNLANQDDGTDSITKHQTRFSFRTRFTCSCRPCNWLTLSYCRRQERSGRCHVSTSST